MKKLMIIGAGPAGISAALYAKRGGIDTTILYMDQSSLNLAHLIDNYYGISIKGEDLYKEGLKQAQSLDIPLIKEEVLAIEYNDHFEIITKDHKYESDALIIATGAYRNTPKVKNLKSFEGMGVSYCAVCDGFFYRKKNVVVLGNGAYAAHEAEYLSNLTPNLTILTNGKKVEDESLNQFNINTQEIEEVQGEGKIQKVLFKDGSSLDIDGFFIAEGTAGSADLARKLGVELDANNKIVTNEKMMSNIPGLYACGDCTKGLMQVSKAVYEGAVAGSDAIVYLKKLEQA